MIDPIRYMNAEGEDRILWLYGSQEEKDATRAVASKPNIQAMQKAFNHVCESLAKQGTRARNPFTGECHYRMPSEDGKRVLKCAVGWLIPDEEYNPLFDLHNSGWSLEEIHLGIPSIKALPLPFLYGMQAIHDKCLKVGTLPDQMARLANRFLLVPDKAALLGTLL